MKITESSIRRIIAEELQKSLKEDDIYMHVGDMSRGNDPNHFMYSDSDPFEIIHALLAMISFADPTMTADVLDAAVYAAQGKREEAAMVIAFSALGLGAGAATVKAMRAAKAQKSKSLRQASEAIRDSDHPNAGAISDSIDQGLRDADSYIDDLNAGRQTNVPDRPAVPDPDTPPALEKSPSRVATSKYEPAYTNMYRDGVPREVRYVVNADGEQFTVQLLKSDESNPVKINFVAGDQVHAFDSWPQGADYTKRGSANPRLVIDEVMETIADFNNRFPDEKLFTFSGARMGQPTLPRPDNPNDPWYLTIRDQAFHLLLKRKLKTDPDLASRVRSVDYGVVGGAYGRTGETLITIENLRRIIREELLREQVFVDGPPWMDPMVHAEWERTGAAEKMRREREADTFFNPATILVSGAADLVVGTGEWAINLLYSGVELRANLGAYLSPPESSTQTREVYLRQASDAAYEVAIGNLMWYGLNAIGPIGKKIVEKVPSLKSSQVTKGKPTAQQQKDLVTFRDEVLTDSLAITPELKAQKEIIDAAIETNKKYNFEKPPQAVAVKSKPKSSKSPEPLPKPSEIRLFDDLADESGYIAPQTVRYNISHKGDDLTVILHKETQSSPVDITFVPKDASWDLSLTSRGDVRGLLDKVVSSVKSYNRQFPKEKNFVFSGVPHGTGYLEKGAGYATKRDRAYNMFMNRTIKRDPDLSDIVSSTGYQTIKGHDGRPQGVTVITLKELHKIIREEILLL